MYNYKFNSEASQDLFWISYVLKSILIFLGTKMQVALSILRVLLYVARPRTHVLGNVPDSIAYRSVDQYPTAQTVPGILILEFAAPIYFANASYLRER